MRVYYNSNDTDVFLGKTWATKFSHQNYLFARHEAAMVQRFPIPTRFESFPGFFGHRNGNLVIEVVDSRKLNLKISFQLSVKLRLCM